MDDKTAAYKYLNEYQKKNYDRITILRKPGEKDRLTKIAREMGYKTVTQFINACIDEKINSFAEPPAQSPISPVEAAEPAKSNYLPATPENLKKIDFKLLKGNSLYQLEAMKIFGEETVNRIYGMSEAEFKKLAHLDNM